jgi:hypothetical protein
MALVVALMSALLLIPAAITAMAIGEISTSQQSVAQDSAYAAAEAGLSAYVNAANNNSPAFFSYNAGGKGTTNTGGSQPTPVSAAWGGNGSQTWEPVPGSNDECYFYETTATSSTQVTVTVTGRLGPPNGGCGAPQAGKTYQYRTISATLLLENATNDPYLYTNEYNVANPFVYGGFSGGINECGYYAYGYNNNWGYVFFGFTFTIGTGADWVPLIGDYDSGPGNDNNGLNANDGDDDASASWATIESAGSVGGATGPSMLGTMFGSSGGWDFNDEIITAPGFGVDMPAPNGYPNGAPFELDSSLANSAYFTGSLGSNSFSFSTDTNGGVGGPNGCGLWGTPYHDSFYTNIYSFNGEGANPKVYSTDAYYICPPYNGGAGGAGFNTNMDNGALGATTWQSGDRWGNNPPSVPVGETSPTAINWSLWGFTLFAVNAINIHYNGSPYYEPGDSGTFTITFFGSSSSVSDIQICGPPNYAAMPTVSLVPTIDPPYTTPLGTSPSPDYTLSSVRAQAACVYSGNVIFTFLSGGGASVNLNGGSVVSGSGCTGTANPPGGVFFVLNGVPEVSGVVKGSYTVASAATGITTISLPGSPVFPYPVLQAVVTNTITNDTGNGAYGGFAGYSDTIPPGSIEIVGDITYQGCPASPPFGNSCTNYLGLLAQDNVVINYPTVTPLGEGTDTDQTWVVTENDINYDADNDGSYQCQPGNNCGGDSVDGPGKYGSSSDGYWQCDYWNCGGYYGFFGPSDPTDGDDYCSFSDWWGCTTHAEGSDTDQGYCTVGGGNCNSTPNGDLSDRENDAVYSGVRGGPGGCADPDCDGYWQPDASPGYSDSDGDDTVASTNVEMHDGNGFVHTIDAFIDAVWGSFYLDNYGYWSNADHSCATSVMYLGVTNVQNEPSDDSNNSNGGCVSDGDGDEGTIGTLTVNGAVSEFWRGILTHYEAYAQAFVPSGGYSQVNFNYDPRFMNQLPPAMIGPGGNQWQTMAQLTTAAVCPTGTVNASGQEITAACP